MATGEQLRELGRRLELNMLPWGRLSEPEREDAASVRYHAKEIGVTFAYAVVGTDWRIYTADGDDTLLTRQEYLDGPRG